MATSSIPCGFYNVIVSQRFYFVWTWNYFFKHYLFVSRQTITCKQQGKKTCTHFVSWDNIIFMFGAHSLTNFLCDLSLTLWQGLSQQIFIQEYNQTLCHNRMISSIICTCFPSHCFGQESLLENLTSITHCCTHWILRDQKYKSFFFYYTSVFLVLIILLRELKCFLCFTRVESIHENCWLMYFFSFLCK